MGEAWRACLPEEGEEEALPHPPGEGLAEAGREEFQGHGPIQLQRKGEVDVAHAACRGVLQHVPHEARRRREGDPGMARV